jgi:hypothetical protein
MNIDEILKTGGLFAISQIKGPFSGFCNKKLFPLTNGQCWLQISDEESNHIKYNPGVVIYLLKDHYYLILTGTNEFVEVRLIKDFILSEISNDFNGWSSDAIFELANGQTWQQTENIYEYESHYFYHPMAYIYNVGTGYRIYVGGKSVAVKKIN